MRKIIFPTDFSANALNALHFATELFKYEKVEMLIVHAYASEVYDQDTYFTEQMFNRTKRAIEIKCLDKLAELQNQLQEFSPNPKHVYKISAVFDLLIDVINDLAADEDVDLVIMGTKGESNSKIKKFGSNALEVIKYVNTPVLTIPEEFAYTQLKNILFVTDFMIPYKRRELKLLSSLVKSYRGSINLLYINSNDKLCNMQEYNKLFLEETLKECELKTHIIDGVSIAKVTKAFILSNKIDLLVMVNSRHSPIENILYQSVIDTMELNFEVPFLVMQNLKRS